MNPQNNHPTQQVEKVLSWLCKPEVLEEILGDLEEYYAEIAEKPYWQRAIFYWFQAINFLRPFALKKINTFQPTNPTPMFRNYYKTSSRSLMRNPLSSFINIFGLSVAIGVCVFAFGFSQWVHNIDQFHENKHTVYLTTFFADRGGTLQQNGLTPRPLGEMLRADFSAIKRVCQLEDRNVVIKYNDQVFREQVRFSDPEFLDMFTFPLQRGSKNSLSDLNSIILSEEAAIKYFGNENPVGQDVRVIFEENNSKVFTVSGVAAPFPDAHAIDFDFLVHFDNLKGAEPDYDLDDWGKFVDATLIQVDDPTDMTTIEQGMEKYRQLQNEAEQEWVVTEFAFEPLATLYQKSGDIRNSISRPYYSDNHKSEIILSILALILLALACANYVNIAIISAAKRLKEIGLRKVIGASRRMVITQFLVENVFVTCFALLLGVFLAITVIIPWFEQLIGFSMDFQLVDYTLWLFLVVVLFLTGIASGLYPSFYIAGFNVVNIFKGSVRFGQKNAITRLLLGVQLALACLLIVCAVMFTRNNTYIADRDWGYRPQGVVYTSVPDYSAFKQLKNAMIQDPNVTAISGSSHHLGQSHANTVVRKSDRLYEVHQLSVDAQYFEAMGLEIRTGRTFRDRSENDQRAVVANELFIKNLHLENPIGQLTEIDSVKYEIIGVVRDFHPYSFANAVQPTVFTLAPEQDYRFLSIRAKADSENKTYAALRHAWAKLFPEVPFQGGYQEDIWGSYFEEIATHGRVWRAVAFVAILLAGLGLFGLVALNVSGRTQEFSIRKALGANLKHIAAIILRQYLLLFVIALGIGAPLSYFLTAFFFDSVYTYHAPVTVLSVVLSALILLTVLLAVIFTQVGKVSKSNLLKGLRTE
ncbi:MAG: ABC transporter permease [Bacteroidota bacterium]